MPVTKSAKKKLRQDKKKEEINNVLRRTLKNAIKAARKKKSADTVSKAVRAIDKASKNKLLHKNKAARIKSSLSKGLKPKTEKKAEKTKTPAKKVKAKK